MSSQDNIALEKFRVADENLTCAPFDLTEDITPLGDDTLIAQERAEKALWKGFATPSSMFVVGLGSVNSAFLRNLQGKADASMSADKVCDTIFVRSPEDLGRFRFIDFPRGKGTQFQQDMVRFLEGLKESIPLLFEKESFQTAENEIRNRAHIAGQDALRDLEKEEEEKPVDSQQFGSLVFVHQINTAGITLFPAVLDMGKRPLDAQEYQNLEESEREEIDNLRNHFMERVQEIMAEMKKRESGAEQEIENLKRESLEFLFGEKTEKILRDYGEAVFSFINGLREHTLANLNAFQPRGGSPLPPTGSHPQQDVFLPFQVDIFVDNSKVRGIPVVDHRSASYEDIFGRVKTITGPDGMPRVVEVEAGLLSKANHGVLVLSVHDVFSSQAGMWGVWERLQAVLETKRLDVRSTRLNWFGTENTTNTSSEVLRVDVKLVLVGDEHIYRLLNISPATRNDFEEVFKTIVFFDPVAPRSSKVVGQLRGLIETLCETGHLPEVQNDGIEEILRFLSRRVAHQNKFRLDARAIKDILEEAAWISREELGDEKDSAVIAERHIRQAIHDREERVGLIRDKMHEMITEGTILLTFEGSEIGQVNGLAVYDLGDTSFGRPTRITARTFAGTAGIVNIERESHMDGSTHSKGVLILGGYLGGEFAQKRPLTLSATLVFEQSYEGVDGDSASSTELYALLSSLSGVPLNQGIAVTGSVNQMGEIQPIGGVNQKIEGTFDVCSALGLTEDQGVMIPHQNVKNLVLRQDVIDAIKARRFHIWAIKTIKDGIEVLTGMEAGERDGTGKYPNETLYRRVDERLEKLSKNGRSFWQRLFGNSR